jgi:hypothetical protein
MKWPMLRAGGGIRNTVLSILFVTTVLTIFYSVCAVYIVFSELIVLRKSIIVIVGGYFII